MDGQSGLSELSWVWGLSIKRDSTALLYVNRLVPMFGCKHLSLSVGFLLCSLSDRGWPGQTGHGNYGESCMHCPGDQSAFSAGLLHLRTVQFATSVGSISPPRARRTPHIFKLMLLCVRAVTTKGRPKAREEKQLSGYKQCYTYKTPNILYQPIAVLNTCATCWPSSLVPRLEREWQSAILP